MSTQGVQTQNAFLNLRNWQQNNQKLDELELSICNLEITMDDEYVNMGGTPEAQNSVFAKYGEEYSALQNQFDDLAQTTPYDFNLMENNNGRNYVEQLVFFGMGEVIMQDRDDDNEVSLSEFIVNQTKDLGENPTSEEMAITKAYSYLLFKLLDEGTPLSDSNSKLNALEMAKFYENVDKFNAQVYEDGSYTGQQVQADGIISHNDISLFPDWIINGVFGEAQIQEAIDMFME